MNDNETNDSKPQILWIHGFAGKPDNDTVKEMRKRYPEYDFYSIEVDFQACQDGIRRGPEKHSFKERS